jgi:hypothetical protein
MKSEFFLKSVIAGSLLLIITIYLLYRGPDFPFGKHALYCLVAALVLALTFFFLWKARLRWLDLARDRNVGTGLMVGLLWTVEIGMNNIIHPGLPLRDIIDDIFWAVIALLILAASVNSAWKSDKISQGIASGFWTGLSSGAVACITALTLIVFGMGLIRHDPLNIREWLDMKSGAGTGSMAVYFAYQTLAGAIMHLVILGIIMGLILGCLGGLIGKGLAILN